MIHDPDSAVAASICYLARWAEVGPVRKVAAARHPSRCEWCDYPRQELVSWIEDFNRRDEIVSGALSAAFRRLSPNAQRALVDAAMYGAAVQA